MSKKPLVPNKNPKGRGKGMGNAGKAAKATKAPRRIRICSRLSKGMLTILIAEVDSIAKGLKRFKGLKGLKRFKGGGTEDDYYKRLEGLFSEENMKNIKRLKEDLVNNILGTMTEGLENLVIFKTDMGVNETKKIQLLKFISIINDIDNLGQEHIDCIISNDSLKALPYIEKITTLVMINMFKKVYNLKYQDRQIQEPSFKYLDNTKLLIKKITDVYNGVNNDFSLQGLTEDVKRELEYYNYIYILNDYDATKDDDNDAKKIEEIIEWMIDECIRVGNNEFKSFINNPILKKDNFTTGCDNNSALKVAIVNYNGIIKNMKDTSNSLEKLTTTNYTNKIYIVLTGPDPNIKIFSYIKKNYLKSDLYELYKLYDILIQYEDIMKLISNRKEEYKNCVKAFYDNTITIYTKKELLTPQRKQGYTNALIELSVITDLEASITVYNNTYDEIKNEFEKWGEIENNIANNIPVDLTNIVFLYNKLCNYNTIYQGKYKQIENDANIAVVLKKKRDIEVKKEEREQNNIDKELLKINENLKDITNKLSTTTILPEAKANLEENRILQTARQTQLEKELEELKDKIAENKLKYENNIRDENNRVRRTTGEFGGGKLTTKYISTGDFVYILYEKKKIKRCVYAKAKGRGKYCKIKGDYILVSKLKVV
jgi:hypothetical protein